MSKQIIQDDHANISASTLTGPFTKDNFSLEKWKYIKERIYFLNSQNEEETLPDIHIILEFMKKLNSFSNYEDFFGELQIKNWFFNDFLPATAKNFINTKTFVSKEVLELSNDILEQMALFFIKVIHEDNPKLCEMLKIILDPSKSYFKFNNQEESASSAMSSFMREPTKEHLEWIKNLKIDDLVDCIKIDQNFRKVCWSQAKVVLVLENHLKVQFLYERDTFSRFIDKVANANEIASYKTKALDWEWRLGLKPFDVVDGCDTSQVWYNCTVLEEKTMYIDEDTPVKEILIGYRTYDENGDKTDHEGRRYFGWSSKFDEWISVTSPRIQPRNKLAKKLYLQTKNDDPTVDDSSDYIFTLEDKKIYALTRAIHCRSTVMIRIINNFGEAGGFQKIVDRISDTKNWAPIEIVSYFVTILGNIQALLHRDFCFEYIFKFKEAVWKNILKSPESNIRNFNKDRIENIITAFDGLLKRVYSIPEKNELIETFNLEVTIICFDSNFLERKIQGLKSLLEIIKNIKYNNSKYLTNEHINQVLENSQLFDKIYGKTGHIELIKRSSDFLKYMINENLLKIEQLESIWELTKQGNTETKVNIYKVLSEVGSSLRNDHLDYIISRISEIPSTELIPDEIELVYELTKLSLRSSNFIKKSKSFYWSIIVNGSQYNNEILDLALNKYCDIAKSWELRDEKYNVLLECIYNIEKGISVLSSLKIMKKLIESFPISPSSTEKYTKSSIVDEITNENELIQVLINNLQNFKNQLKKRCQEVYKTTLNLSEGQLDNLIGDKSTYITHISERLQFIHYVLSNGSNEVCLTYKLLSEIWDIIVNDALLKNERDVVYKWLKESAESKGGFPMSIADLIQFFKYKMTDTIDSKSMTIDGFNSFRNIFLLINEKMNNITKISSNNTNTPSVTNYATTHSIGGTYYSSYSYNYDDNKINPQNDFEYKINVYPEKLEGMNSIWDFILTAENENVVEKAIEFLNKLYIHVSNELETQIVNLRTEYLKTCISHLRLILDQKERTNEQELTNGVNRCLNLIKSLLDESEKNGIGSLKSHSGLVKGELLTFAIVNDLTSGSDVPKKFDLRIHSNKTIYDLRIQVAKQVKSSWDQVKLLRIGGTKEIKDNENGRTLGDMRMRNGELLTVTKRPTPPIPQVNLVNPDGNLNPLAKKVFTDWFEQFSENGKMSPDHCAAFIHSCTNDNCKGDDKRVKDVFLSYDDDKDGFLTLENFINFYYIASKSRPHIVWNNITAHHYRNDLKKATEIEQEVVDITLLPRYIISSNTEYFQLIFSLLDYGGNIAIEAWKLLNRLPTSPEIYKNIVWLKGVRGVDNPNWEAILDISSNYKLLYALHVIEYLMEESSQEYEETNENAAISTGEKNEINNQSSSNAILFNSNDDKTLDEYKKNWKADFIVYGGFDHLFKIFMKFSTKETLLTNIFEKNILSFILKILRNYLTAAFAIKVPNLYRTQSFIRLFHLSLEFINNYMKAETNKYLEEGNNPATTTKINIKKVSDSKEDEKNNAVLPDQIKSDTTANKPTTILSSSSSLSTSPTITIAGTGATTGASTTTGGLGNNSQNKDDKKLEKLKIEENADFKLLVERLKGDLGDHIISTLNLKDMIKLITTLGYDIITKTIELESEDRLIIEYSLSILISILLYNKDNIIYFLNPYNNPEYLMNTRQYIIDGIFYSKSINIRKYFSHALFVLSKESIEYQYNFVSKYLIDLLLRNLPSSKDENKKDCNQYFELLCKLIEGTYQQKNSNDDSHNIATTSNRDINKALNQIINTNNKNNIEFILNFDDLIHRIIIQIKDHESTEKRNNTVNDRIFIGLLNLCDKILGVKPELKYQAGDPNGYNIVYEIFYTCLFDVHERENRFGEFIEDPESLEASKEYVKCKGRDSRAIAYKLLCNLCKNNERNTKILVKGLNELMQTILNLNTISKSWNYSPSGDAKSFYGYIGIRNLGCICYMNAMLQQFYMTPSFRYSMLMIDDKKESNLVKKDNKYLIDDNVVHQLQQMFSFLELSDRQDYDPHEFCFSFKDYAGQPVNTSIQQDAQEFLNMIFDKLENGIKHTPFKYILEGIYGGKTCTQLICSGCKTKREREEIFYNLSLEVRNHKTIYDSFEKFITGETIDDYYCDECKKRISTTKRLCISNLPNVMIVHLQRIVFNLDTLMNEKINSRLEFPFELNLEPYTKEGLEWREKSKELQKQKIPAKLNDEINEKDQGDIAFPEEDQINQASDNNNTQAKENAPEVLGPYELHPKEYYEYKLAGVVVHVGTAEFGHYYSYINTNRGDPARRQSTAGQDKWLEFNDSIIKDFDPKSIENECFGGSSGDTNDDSWGWAKAGRENSKNAYILVYERVIKEPLKLMISNEEDKTYIQKALKMNDLNINNSEDKVQESNNEGIQNSYLIDYYKIKRSIPEKIYKKVWQDNHKFMFERHLYSEDFFKFVKEICNSLELPDLSQKNLHNYIYKDYKNIPEETQEMYKRIIQILSVLDFNVLARASENSTLTELTKILNNLLSLVPNYTIYFFENVVFKEFKRTLELILNCPTSLVRTCISQTILQAINIIISYYNLDLNIKKQTEKENKDYQLFDNQHQINDLNHGANVDNEEYKKREEAEDMVMKFLKLFMAVIPTEVAKNWTKFQQYFEFWRDFAFSGEVQISFLFQKQFIAVLIDFYLEKKSPIPDFSEKKHSMGNRYTDPFFHPLIQTLSLLVRRSVLFNRSSRLPRTSLANQGYKLYEMSENDIKCINSHDFYEKTMREKYDPPSFGLIIEHFSFENEMFSNQLASLILRGINRCNFEEAYSYLEAIGYFLNIQDYLQPKRIEWILGFPQPIMNTHCKTESYGMYGNSTLEEYVITYETPLCIEGATSLLNIILHNIKKIESLTAVCLKQLLILLDANPTVFEYIVALPPPSYNMAKFSDWMESFVDSYLSDAKRYYYGGYPKEELGLEIQKLLKKFEEKLNKKIQMNESIISKLQKQQIKQQNPEKIIEEYIEEKQHTKDIKEQEPLKGVTNSYIIGQTIKEDVINEKKLTEPNDDHDITLLQTEVTCYITESKPILNGNLAFPPHIVKENYLMQHHIRPDSPLVYFIQAKQDASPEKNNKHGAKIPHVQESNDVVYEEVDADLAPLLADTERPERSKNDQQIDFNPDSDISRKNYHENYEQHNVQGPTKPIVIAEISDDAFARANSIGTSNIEKRETENIQDISQTNKGSNIVDSNEVKPSENNISNLDAEEAANQQANNQEDIPFDFKYSKESIIRRFILNNNSNYTVVLRLQIVPQPNDFLNFRIPSSTFCVTIGPQSQQQVLALIKILPDVAWGNYDFICNIQKFETKMQFNGNVKGERYGGIDEENQKKRNANFQIRPINMNKFNKEANFNLQSMFNYQIWSSFSTDNSQSEFAFKQTKIKY